MNRSSWIPNYTVPLWAQRSKYYLMEFIAALLGLLVTTFLLDRVFFALARYLSDASATNSNYDQMNLWVVAMLVVWLPVTVLFYKRSRFEELERPSVASTKLRRFFLYVFMLATLLAAVGFAITTVYSTLLVIFGAAEAETLLQQSLPAFLATALHSYLFRTFMKRNTALLIKSFAFVYGIVGLVLLAALLVMSSLQARGSLVDEKTSKDLKQISVKVDSYYNDKGKLPASLGDLSLDSSIDKRGKKHGYSFERRTSYSYRLCAEFKAKSDGKRGDGYIPLSAEPAIYPAPSNSDFFRHGKGRHCFDLTASGRAYPADDYNRNSNSSSSDLDSLLDVQGTNLY